MSARCLAEPLRAELASMGPRSLVELWDALGGVPRCIGSGEVQRELREHRELFACEDDGRWSLVPAIREQERQYATAFGPAAG